MAALLLSVEGLLGLGLVSFGEGGMAVPYLQKLSMKECRCRVSGWRVCCEKFCIKYFYTEPNVMYHSQLFIICRWCMFALIIAT